jgi:hypothetical protein
MFSQNVGDRFIGSSANGGRADRLIGGNGVEAHECASNGSNADAVSL